MTDKKTDAVGPSLLPEDEAKPESSVQQRYMKTFAGLLLLQGPVVAWSLYFITKYLSSEASVQLMKTRFALLNEFQLYCLYWPTYIILVLRLILDANANGARGPVRLDRPDQHIYQVVGKGDLVRMACEGDAGRFNRAQRGLFNMDESLSIMVATTVLVSLVLGPLVCFFLLPLYAYGRTKFAYDDKSDPAAHTGGFLCCMIGEHGMCALVGLIAIKTTFRDLHV